ncbi:hypothetical protein GCM10009865_30140 [Aeromicrobium ponti]|uniref:Uncharacterized protein n=1 Tax=Cytobacillus oceanisediminis TaxID=665099 RepID=A0A562JRH9_9BACI|nr:hypothetical protein [Cytobacillus oceanisediminis]TWH85766.1 hypothetical protein IQ19_02707 [Cytobacillus oceanisediminis]
MKVHEVIETKEMFCGEIMEDYYIIYEQIENMVFENKDNYLFQKESFVVRTINVYKGNSNSTLQKVKTYPIKDVRNIRKIIVNDFPGLFKKVQFAS